MRLVNFSGPEGEQCKIGSLLWDISCLEYHFRQLLFRLKHYMIKSDISVSHLSNLEFFESGKFWRLLGRERCILEGWSWKLMLFKMTFLTIFISTKTINGVIVNNCNLWIFRIWKTWVTPAERTMHPGWLIMEINIV